MEHRGESLMQFMRKNTLTEEKIYVFAFDMGIQLLQALKVIHQAGYVHGDMKPDNICVKEIPQNEQEQTKRHFQFSLIDFGMIQKLKLKKTLNLKKFFTGNIWFSSVNGLKQKQLRY